MGRTTVCRSCGQLRKDGNVSTDDGLLVPPCDLCDDPGYHGLLDEQIEEIEERRAELTDLPWAAIGESGDWRVDCTLPADSPSYEGRTIVEMADQATAEFLANAPDDIDYLVERVSQLHQTLRRLEWAGAENHDWAPECPACRALRGEQHAPDCWLAKELSSRHQSQ